MREAGGGEDCGGVRSGRTHRPCGMEGGGERGRGDKKGFGIGSVGGGVLRKALVTRVYGVTIEQCSDAVAVKAAR